MDYKSFIKNIEKQNGYKIKVKGGAVGKPNAFNISLVIYKKGLLNYFVLIVMKFIHFSKQYLRNGLMVLQKE